MYYESSLSDGADIPVAERSPPPNKVDTRKERPGVSAASVCNSAPSHKSSTNQISRGTPTEWTDAKFLLACLKHVTVKPTIDYLAVGKVFDWRTLSASNGRFSRIVERLGPRWDEELHHTRAVDKTPAIWNEKFLESCFKHMTKEPKIDFEAVAKDIGMPVVAFAARRFVKIVHFQLHASWCSDSQECCRGCLKFRIDHHRTTKPTRCCGSWSGGRWEGQV